VNVDVTLIAVSIRYENGAPQFVGLRVGDRWPRATVAGKLSATVDALVGDLPPEFEHVLTARQIKPERVTFRDEDGGALNLIYTLALPIPLGNLEVDGAEWVPLLAAATKHADARKIGFEARGDAENSGTMLEWWKELLEEDAGVFALLPQHFTARQARDVYSAIWGYEQDADSFGSWSGIGRNRSQGVLSRWIEPEPLTEGDLLEQFVDVICKSRGREDESDHARALATVVARDASEKMVGLDPSSPIESAGVVTRSALFSAAALIAYQVRARGPKPAWFRQPKPGDTDGKLQDLYTPRPTWVYPPATSTV